MSERYARSEQQLARALATIPLGAQTFSKSITHFPRGAAPLFLERGKGSRVHDVDGHEYIDWVNALCAVTLGYGDPDVDEAVMRQLRSGVSFSLSHPLEAELAERIVAAVPCAERVRFGKNGSDATAAAVRLARAHTGRDHVAMCGYHGWHDWSIGTTSRDAGVPAAVRALTHSFEYNSLSSLEAIFREHPDAIACVILEAASYDPPAAGFLEGVAELARSRGALVIFDETITGFRFARGGAQELYGVVPDLATLGKGMANGYPLSAVAGRADLMRGMEEIFFSSTFGGETLSLAAACAVLDKIEREPVIDTLWARGEEVVRGVHERIAKHATSEWIALKGEPPWSILSFADAEGAAGADAWALRTLFLQEMLARGILIIGSHNLSYAHSRSDVARLLEVYDEVLQLMSAHIRAGSVRDALQGPVLEPLFRVRGA